MRRAVLPLALLLALAGCTADTTSEPEDEQSEQELVNACEEVTEVDVASLVGVPVVAQGDHEPGDASTCSFLDTDDRALLTVLVLDRSESLGSAVAFVTGSRKDVTTEPVEVDGVDEAVIVDDTIGNAVSTKLVARDESAAYVVSPTGLTRDDELRVGTAALALLLGGELDPSDAVDRSDVPHPCRQLTAVEVGGILGAGATAARARAVTAGGARRQCAYEAPGGSASLTDLGPARVDNAASPLGGDRGEEVAAPGSLTVYQSASPEQAGGQLFVATDRTVLALQVETGDPAADRRLASALLPALT